MPLPRFLAPASYDRPPNDADMGPARGFVGREPMARDRFSVRLGVFVATLDPFAIPRGVLTPRSTCGYTT